MYIKFILLNTKTDSRPYGMYPQRGDGKFLEDSKIAASVINSKIKLLLNLFDSDL